MLVTEKSNFMRGDKASASVRLRSKKGAAMDQIKKKNRHSGDFSFFKSQQNNHDSAAAEKVGVAEAKKGGDWAYITFQNGVPTVQDIKTNVGPVGPVGVALVNGATPTPRPVKVVTHQMPAINKRVSGDFSMYTPAMMATPMMRPTPNMNNGRGPTPNMNNGRGPTPNVMYRRKSEYTNGGVALQGGAAKRCSGEFDMNRRSSLYMEGPAHNFKEATPPSVVRVHVNYGNNRPKSAAYSPDIVRGTPTPSKMGVVTEEAPPMPRPPGLGRRAVTQLNMKKNSYNSAIFKSQENLVKVSD